MFFFLKPIKWAFKLLSLLVFAAVVYVVVSGVQVVRAEGGTSGRASLAIVVTGSNPKGAATPGPELLGRLRHALSLYQAHRAPRIVVAGPTLISGSSVAESSRGWLVAEGVPASAVTTLNTSNANEFAAIAKSLGTHKRVLIVTDAVDALWAKDAAAGAGLRPAVSPVPGTKVAPYTQIGALFTQATGVAAGRIIGYGHAEWAAS